MFHLVSNLGRTGNIRLPKDESCVTKYPDEAACALCKAALCDALIATPSVGCVEGKFDGEPVGVTANEVFNVGATPCFNSICFFNCNSSKIFLFCNSLEFDCEKAIKILDSFSSNKRTTFKVGRCSIKERLCCTPLLG